MKLKYLIPIIGFCILGNDVEGDVVDVLLILYHLMWFIAVVTFLSWIILRLI